VAGRHLRGTTIGGSRFGPKSASFAADTYEDQATYTVWQSLTKEMEDTLGICVYVGTWSGAYALEPCDYAELANGVLGTDLDEEDLFFQARRSYNLEKAFNTLHTDFDRKDDYPPARFLEEPVHSGRYEGEKCHQERWDEMLDRFYELHEWDKATGLQTKRLLEKLGLPEIARRLEEKGKLIR
jgi:aldehyde:ferredoxin oxidoreductase